MVKQLCDVRMTAAGQMTREALMKPEGLMTT